MTFNHICDGCYGLCDGLCYGQNQRVYWLVTGVTGYVRARARKCVLRMRLIVSIVCASPARVWANARHTRNTRHTLALVRVTSVTGSRAPRNTPSHLKNIKLERV